jgi:hypothetical protein
MNECAAMVANGWILEQLRAVSQNDRHRVREAIEVTG